MPDPVFVPANWFESFFTPAVNDFWAAMTPPEATAADLAFVTRHLGAAAPARVLDIPCGSGRHALGLARAGYEVTGVDLSEDAIRRAAATAEDEGPAPRFIRADMREFLAGDGFDAVICLGNSVGYFGPDETQRFFRNLAGSAVRGARLILDTYTCAESIFPLTPSRELSFEGGSYAAQLSYEPMTSVLQTRAELRLGAETHALLYAHHVFTSGELVRMLGAAGFRIEGLFGGADDVPFGPGAPRLLLVASRV